jgi:hypothetical protein
MRCPVRVWRMRPVTPGSDFGEPGVLFQHASRAVVDAWVQRVWPHGLPPLVVVGRIAEDGYLARLYAPGTLNGRAKVRISPTRARGAQ